MKGPLNVTNNENSHIPISKKKRHSFKYNQSENLWFLKYTIFYQVQCALLYIENDAEIFPAYYTWKVAEKGFKVDFMMNKLPMINSCEIFLKK